MTRKITFIIPSLNRETLPNTVKSLLDQTNDNWECIIVYDGVDGIHFDDGRIQTIRIDKTGDFSNHHGKSGLVRNKGIEVANTEWIGFLDDDDTINSDYVKTLFEKYVDYDFVVWRMRYSNGRVLPSLQNSNLIFGDVGISFCYKNKFNSLLFDNNRDGEDFDFLMKLKDLTNNWVITPEVYYNVRH
jgi:glycosyltransferase involved in cell wall biosynthesis